MSGKYYDWFRSLSPFGPEDKRIFNCGILGGRHLTTPYDLSICPQGTPRLLLRLFDRMLQVIEDPQLRIRKESPDTEVTAEQLAVW